MDVLMSSASGYLPQGSGPRQSDPNAATLPPAYLLGQAMKRWPQSAGGADAGVDPPRLEACSPLLVVVNRKRTRMYFYDRGRQIWSAPVGVGKPSTPTPPGVVGMARTTTRGGSRKDLPWLHPLGGSRRLLGRRTLELGTPVHVI